MAQKSNISIKEVLKESWRFYHDHFKSMTFIGFFMGLILVSLFGYYYFQRDSMYDFYSYELILCFFCLVWVQVMMIKTILRLHSDRIGINEILWSPIGSYWRAFWVGLRYIFIVFLPIWISTVFAFFAAQSSPFPAGIEPGEGVSRSWTWFLSGGHLWIEVISGIGFIVAIYYGVLYYFAVTSVVIEAKGIKAFVNSKAMVSRKFGQVLISLLIVIGLFQVFPMFILDTVDTIYFGRILKKAFVIPLVISGYAIFSFPFQNIMMTLLYLKYKAAANNEYFQK